jgi:DNA-binding XRE family transcriptional regulator
VARQAYERASAAASGLARRVRELSEHLDRMAWAPGLVVELDFAYWVHGARTGAVGAAERRRKVLMARQSGYRLAEERKRRGLTQAQLAQAMRVSPGRVSQIERGELATIDAVARYVEALGGRLELIASFGDHTLTVTTTEAA